MEDVYRLLALSRISLLGYTTLYERQKDEILLNLGCKRIYPGESISSIRRGNRINEILDIDIHSKNLVIDMSDVISTKQIPSIIRSLQDEIYAGLHFPYDSTNNSYKLIIVARIHTSISSPTGTILTNFTPNSLLYSCDLAFILNDSGANIVKNRFG